MIRLSLRQRRECVCVRVCVSVCVFRVCLEYVHVRVCVQVKSAECMRPPFLISLLNKTTCLSVACCVIKVCFKRHVC